MVTFTTYSFGCKVNTYEIESIKEELVNIGYKYVEELPADFAIVNTCAVTSTAEKKDMEKIRSISRNFPETKIIVMGCFSQLHPEKVEPIGNVIAVIGSSRRSEIPLIIEKNTDKKVLVENNSRIFAYEELSISSFNSPYRAFLKIQDGCDNFCSYCVIPLVRGKSRSRPKDQILKEVRRLAENGYREIVLIGIDTGAYKDSDGSGFSSLIEDILKVEPKSFRLRISSIEETQIDSKLISILKNDKRLVPHLHIPLQSGSEKVLSLMRRKYDLKRFISLTDTLKKEVDGLALSTDVIVGFPSESEADFKDTCDFVKRVGFMRTHVFPYSRRPFTSANLMKEQIDPLIKKKRARELIAIGKELADSYLKSFEKKPLDLLIEEELPSKGANRAFRGYTENYLDLQVESQGDLLGKIVKVTIDGQGNCKLI